MIAKTMGFNISGYTPMYLFIASILAIVCMQFVPLQRQRWVQNLYYNLTYRSYNGNSGRVTCINVIMAFCNLLLWNVVWFSQLFILNEKKSEG